MLKVYGGDYAAIEFQDHFSGRKISELIENFSEVEAEFRNMCEEHEIEVIELNIDQKTFDFFREFQDYEESKHTKLYNEHETL